MTDLLDQWKKSSRSSGNGECVEVRGTMDALRDSKNISGPTLNVPLSEFIAVVKAGKLDR
jgi:hypothetical protein